MSKLLQYNNNKNYISLLFVLTVIASLFAISFSSNNASAQQTGSDFIPNRIIDDSLFYSGNELSSSQIQQFLNARVPICDTNGQKIHWSGQTRAQWASANNRPSPPYTCLKDYVASSTPSKSDSGLCSAMPARGNRTAAQIIDDVSRACNISQKVLLVTLEKEQSLLSDDWPWPVQYEKAMGYYCPDDPNRPGWCAPEYAGFFNQVYNAARQLQRYRQQPSSFNHAINRTSYVAYQANAPSCSGTNLTMQTAATAGLYNYTPYQPNTAALNNLYGTGDSCSAYGNRNFWRMYRDWFGSTYGEAYKAQYYRQSAYPSMFPGDSSIAFIDYRNAGSSRWYDSTSAPIGIGPVNLATTGSINRSSVFGTNWGSGRNRPATTFYRVYEADGNTLASNQNIADPGQIVRFRFVFTASNNQSSGQFTEWFQPILEGSPNWNIGGQAWLRATVAQPVYSASFHSQSSYPRMKQNESQSGFIMYKNTGNQNWYTHWSTPNGVSPVTLATSNNINRSSVFGSNWGSGKNRPAVRFTEVYESNGTTLASNQDFVKPGQIAKFSFNFVTPTNIKSGTYREWFQPILEGTSNWNIGGKAWLQVTVDPTTQLATFDGQCNYPVITKGSSENCLLRYKNTGNNDWYHPWSAPAGIRPITLATSVDINRPSVFGSTWGSGKNRPAARFSTVFEANGTTPSPNQNVVKPGQIAQFDFTFTVPSNASSGTYREWFQPILEGASNWNIGGKAWLQVVVP